MPVCWNRCCFVLIKFTGVSSDVANLDNIIGSKGFFFTHNVMNALYNIWSASIYDSTCDVVLFGQSDLTHWDLNSSQSVRQVCAFTHFGLVLVLRFLKFDKWIPTWVFKCSWGTCMVKVDHFWNHSCRNLFLFLRCTL